MNNFYVYVYLDPRKPGNYQYGDYTFDFEPFYVGKGSKMQYRTHLDESKGNRSLKKINNKYKYYKIKNILKENLKPIILKVEVNLTELESFDLEIWLIWTIGRFDLKLGPLTNLTNGGEGSSGHIHTCSFETKIKMSESKKGEKCYNFGKMLTPETKKKLSESHKDQPTWIKGKHHTEKTKIKISSTRKNLPIETRMKINEKISISNKNRPKISQETRKKMSDAQKGKVFSEDHKRKLKEAKKGHFVSQETKDKLRILNLGKVISPNTKQKLREKAILQWKKKVL